MSNKRLLPKNAGCRFKYKSMTVVSINESKKVFEVYAEITGNPSACSQCKKNNIVKFGYLNEKILDKPLSEKKVVVHLKKQRSRCNDCGKTFTIENNDKYGSHQVTKSLATYIKKASKKKTVSCISKEIGVARSTIRGLLGL